MPINDTVLNITPSVGRSAASTNRAIEDRVSSDGNLRSLPACPRDETLPFAMNHIFTCQGANIPRCAAGSGVDHRTSVYATSQRESKGMIVPRSKHRQFPLLLVTEVSCPTVHATPDVILTRGKSGTSTIQINCKKVKLLHVHGFTQCPQVACPGGAYDVDTVTP